MTVPQNYHDFLFMGIVILEETEKHTLNLINQSKEL